MVPQLFVPPARGSSTYLAAHRAQLVPERLQVNFIDLKSKEVLSGPRQGEDFRTINPRGNAPSLLLDDGTLLHESGAIMQWIADQNPESALLPPPGSLARYEAISKLNYINSELQPCCEPLMGDGLNASMQDYFREKLKSKLAFVSEHMLPAGPLYLQGDTFTVADAKLYFVLSWLPRCGVDLATFPTLKKYWDHIGVVGFVWEAIEALESRIETTKT